MPEDQQMPNGPDTKLQRLIELALTGDCGARQTLIARASDRLLRLTRKMFHDFPALRRWEQTDDVFQNAMIRLDRALRNVRLESERHFFNLAAEQIRRELLDLKKHYFGPCGSGTSHHTDGQPADEKGGIIHSRADEPDDVEMWSELHVQVSKLPEAEREVFNLRYYDGLTAEETAMVLGISLASAKRIWRSARLKLHEAVKRDEQGN